MTGERCAIRCFIARHVFMQLNVQPPKHPLSFNVTGGDLFNVTGFINEIAQSVKGSKTISFKALQLKCWDISMVVSCCVAHSEGTGLFESSAVPRQHFVFLET